MMGGDTRTYVGAGLAGLAAFGAAAGMQAVCTQSKLDAAEHEHEPHLASLITEAIDWAACHGLLVRGVSSGFDHCPVSLLPTPFPRKAFEEAKRMGSLFARLTDRVARNPEWLCQTLEAAAAADEFTRSLFEIYKDEVVNAAKSGKSAQQVYLGIHRSDYMLHEETQAEKDMQLFQAQANGAVGDGPKLFMQVELNTIASSFGCMGHLASELHRFMLSRHKAQVDQLPNLKHLEAVNCPQNDNHKILPTAMRMGHNEYCRLRGVAEDAPAIVFVIQAGEKNAVDQRFLEFELWDKYNIKVLRRSLLELSAAKLEQDQANREVLKVDGHEISLCYFRAGYTPKDYPGGGDGLEWIARKRIERSFAIKCPSIAYHLVGAKKVQQALATPGEVEKFLSAREASQLRRSFAGLFELTAEVIAAAKASPHLFVLKPQREGGGNNFYGADIPAQLAKMSEDEKDAYILMQRIFPPKQQGILVRQGIAVRKSTLSELGVFSVYIGDGDKELMNEVAGHMLRTKPDDADEGGVAAGFAVIDSPCLVD